MSKKDNNLEWGAIHATLVLRAKKWLETHSYFCVVAELSTSGREIPDAIGWRHREYCMIDCKASHTDFLSDSKKASRKENAMMGNLRYYMCPPSIIRPEELTNGWGLLYAYPKQIKVIVKARHNSDLSTYRHEHGYLVSMLRRFEIRYGMNPITEPLGTGKITKDSEAANEQKG